MARILAYTSPARGHLFPAVPILDELRRRGHVVSLRTLSAEVPMALRRGFQTEAINPAIEAFEHDDWRASSSRLALERVIRVFLARAEHEIPDIRRAIAQEQPDALLVDINCWGALGAAEAWGGPWATFCPFPLPLSSPDVPPFGLGLPPARGLVGRLREAMLRPLVLGVVERSQRPLLNAVRRHLGLVPLRSVDELYLRPPLLIYLTAEPFEYPRRQWPSSVVMVGPCEWDPPAEPPAWLEAIEHPIVLVTTSSEFQNDGHLVELALEALASEPVTLIATMPAGGINERRVPSNARVERFIPHTAVLKRAICAVTHGGMGATQKALAASVPVCAVPFGRDQFEVARRVEVAGAGSRLPAKKLGAITLHRKVQEAIAKGEGARRVAAAFAAAGGPEAAATAFEVRLLRSATAEQKREVRS